MNKVIVIGGGAAGLMAALSAAEAEASVLLLEGNEKLGKKIYITGKGRCNVTNACEPAAFMNKVVKNPRFLFSALNAFAPEDMMALLERLGCPVKVERGDRVFPVSEKASDVTRALEKELRRLGVSIRLNTKVSHILVENTAVCGVELEDGTRLEADRVVVATGGQSYPSTGSTGDGFRWMAELGHTVYPPLPSLIPLTCSAAWVSALQGLSLKNVRLTLKRGKKVLYSDVGEMLFTHFGISGPLVLSVSAHMAELAPEDVELSAGSETRPDCRTAGRTAPAGAGRFGQTAAAHPSDHAVSRQSGGGNACALRHPRANARLRDHPGAARPAGQGGQRTASAGGRHPAPD